MSGHSKWHSIKHKKAAEDAKKGKIFTKHAKLITVAARVGGSGDPDMNPSLRLAIDNARAENMPMDNIERAIKKGTGESKDAAIIEEVMYEGFGPGGVALFIETLTDNKNRTFSNVKLIMSKNGGHLGAAGSVGYLFKKRGIIEVELHGQKAEDIELSAIDAGAEDVRENDGIVEIYTEVVDMMKVKTALEQKGVPTRSAKLTYVPHTEIHVDEDEMANKLLSLIEAIEEEEDVTTVYGNFVFSDEVLNTLKKE